MKMKKTNVLRRKSISFVYQNNTLYIKIN